MRHVSRGSRRGVRIVGVVLVAFGLALLLPPYLLFPSGSLPVRLAYILAGVPLVVFGGALIVARIRYSLANLSTLIVQPSQFELTDEYVLQTSPVHTSQVAWSAIGRIEEIPDQILLWVGKRQFYSVPTTGLTSDHLTELRRFVSDHNAHPAADSTA